MRRESLRCGPSGALGTSPSRSSIEKSSSSMTQAGLGADRGRGRPPHQECRSGPWDNFCLQRRDSSRLAWVSAAKDIRAQLSPDVPTSFPSLLPICPACSTARPPRILHIPLEPAP